MIISEKPNNLNQKKLIEFKEEYIELYPDYLQEEIEEKLLLGFTNSNDTINQIYCYLGLVSDQNNPYKEFIKILKNNFKLNGNILEVGAGTIPILAKYLSEEKDLNITLIDPLIIFDKLVNGKVIKEKFSLNTNIENYDLVIGYNPCGGTENIIRLAIKNKKNFCIATCGCCFLPQEYEERTPEIWHKYLINLAEELSDGNYELKILYFNDKFYIKYPIIVGSYNAEKKSCK